MVAAMAPSSEALVSGVAVALLVILGSMLVWRRHFSKYRNLPPGPRALPIVGSLHLLGTQPHRNLAELASQYGPLMTVWLGQRLCIVASTPEAAKEFLKLQDANFAFRPTIRGAEVIVPKDMVFHEISPPIRHLRKIIVTELMTTKQLESSRYIRKEEMSSTLRRIANENGPTYVKKQVTIMATNVLSRMIFNNPFLGVHEENRGSKMVQEFIDLVEEMKSCFGAKYIGDFFNVPKWFDPQGLNNRFQKLRLDMDKFYKKMVDEYKEDEMKRASKEGKKTLLDIFMEQLNFPENGVTDEHVEGVLYDLLAGGIDTMTITVEWAMAELLNNPKLLTKVTSELDQVIGMNRVVQESDLPNLKYLHAVVKETFRLHPATPLLVPHESKEATKAFGYNIPAQTRLFVNVWAIGHSKNNWEKPLEFIPERFLEGGKNEAIGYSGQHFELLPFGSGRRQCPGMGLALAEAHLQLASLLHAFEWKAQKLVMEESGPGLTLSMQKPLAAMTKKRLPSHLY